MLGDVILTKVSSKASPFNLLSQKLVTGRLFYPRGYTHVALGSGPFQVIHAMPAPWHVEVAAIHELLSPGVEWHVWRNRAFYESVRDDNALAFTYHCKFSESIGESYNGRFFFRDAPEYSYCSQLVGKLAQHMGCPFSRPPFALMPLHIAVEVESSSTWFDVTKEYQQLLDNDDHYRRLYFNQNERDSKAHYAAYLLAKSTNNALNRGFVAVTSGLGPQSRVEFEMDSSGIRVATPNRDTEIGLSGQAFTDLPEPYHGCVSDWTRILNPAAQWLDDDQYNELISLEFPSSATARAKR